MHAHIIFLLNVIPHEVHKVYVVVHFKNWGDYFPQDRQ